MSKTVIKSRHDIERILGFAADLCGCDEELAKHVAEMSCDNRNVYFLRMKPSADPLKMIVVHIDEDVDFDGERYRDRSKATRVEFQR